MTRIPMLFVAFGLLTACSQYREPQANCFSFLSQGATSENCAFTPLSGPELSDQVNE